ncbi:hypothetical protein scyTo_0005137 [Scyliorhinus torazame]|uniref:ethanolamine kinase n=1 Tax=Scyliorhinus torazame TaxID=75743 RepID=A0A401P300_SCYTO|nr:hypothetical protein [Scyliorhinus torazame]
MEIDDLPTLDILVSEIEVLKEHLSQVKSPVVLCHNDLLCKNIIYIETQGLVKFIDYEYSGYNYQAFDIGNHFNEFAGVSELDFSMYPPKEIQVEWLTSYLRAYKECTGCEPVVTDLEVLKLYVQVNKFALNITGPGENTVGMKACVLHCLKQQCLGRIGSNVWYCKQK